MTLRPRPRPRRRRQVMQVIIGLLLASAMLRLATEAGPAIAEISAQTGAETQAPEAGDDGFIAALLERERLLSEREAAFEARLEAMRIAEAELQENLAALEAAEASLLATIAMAETASASDVAQLTAVYENMKPKEAAALFAEMSPDFAAGFLAVMRPDTAAAIMSELEPETAYAFSVVLAGRNAAVPDE